MRYLTLLCTLLTWFAYLTSIYKLDLERFFDVIKVQPKKIRSVYDVNYVRPLTYFARLTRHLLLIGLGNEFNLPWNESLGKHCNKSKSIFSNVPECVERKKFFFPDKSIFDSNTRNPKIQLWRPRGPPCVHVIKVERGKSHFVKYWITYTSWRISLGISSKLKFRWLNYWNFSQHILVVFIKMFHKMYILYVFTDIMAHLAVNKSWENNFVVIWNPTNICT